MATPHWHCPDCGQPCTCTDDLVRLMRHVPCGLTPDQRIQQGIDQGYREVADAVRQRRLYPDALEDGL